MTVVYTICDGVGTNGLGDRHEGYTSSSMLGDGKEVCSGVVGTSNGPEWVLFANPAQILEEMDARKESDGEGRDLAWTSQGFSGVLSRVHIAIQ